MLGALKARQSALAAEKGRQESGDWATGPADDAAAAAASLAARQAAAAALFAPKKTAGPADGAGGGGAVLSFGLMSKLRKKAGRFRHDRMKHGVVNRRSLLVSSSGMSDEDALPDGAAAWKVWEVPVNVRLKNIHGDASRPGWRALRFRSHSNRSVLTPPGSGARAGHYKKTVQTMHSYQEFFHRCFELLAQNGKYVALKAGPIRSAAADNGEEVGKLAGGELVQAAAGGAGLVANAAGALCMQIDRGWVTVWQPPLDRNGTAEARTEAVVAAAEAAVENLGGLLERRADWKAGEKPPAKLEELRAVLQLEKRKHTLAPQLTLTELEHWLAILNSEVFRGADGARGGQQAAAAGDSAGGGGRGGGGWCVSQPVRLEEAELSDLLELIRPVIHDPQHSMRARHDLCWNLRIEVLMIERVTWMVCSGFGRSGGGLLRLAGHGRGHLPVCPRRSDVRHHTHPTPAFDFREVCGKMGEGQGYQACWVWLLSFPFSRSLPTHSGSRVFSFSRVERVLNSLAGCEDALRHADKALWLPAGASAPPPLAPPHHGGEAVAAVASDGTRDTSLSEFVAATDVARDAGGSVPHQFQAGVDHALPAPQL